MLLTPAYDVDRPEDLRRWPGISRAATRPTTTTRTRRRERSRVSRPPRDPDRRRAPDAGGGCGGHPGRRAVGDPHGERGPRGLGPGRPRVSGLAADRGGLRTRQQRRRRAGRGPAPRCRGLLGPRVHSRQPGRLPGGRASQRPPRAGSRHRISSRWPHPAAWRPWRRALREADGVVDALFGTGLARPLTGPAARAVAAIERAGRPVVSADVPSGLFSDTGAIRGRAIRAAATVAFAAPKICHALPPARRLCGRVVVADIGIPQEASDGAGSPALSRHGGRGPRPAPAARPRRPQARLRERRGRRGLAGKDRRGHPRRPRRAARRSRPRHGLLSRLARARGRRGACRRR